jgi:two-component system, cell cycle sensor histidine kinase and response regulator CckA
LEFRGVAPECELHFAFIRFMSNKPKPIRVCWLSAAYFAAHVLAHASAQWFEVTPGISIWYAPAGLALAFLVLAGPRYMPVVLLANLSTAWWPAPPVETWMVIFFPVLITLSYGGAAMAVRKLQGPRLMPGTPRETLVFCLTLTLVPLVMAMFGTWMYCVLAAPTNAVPDCDFWPWVGAWWVGDASGALTVVPVVMVFVAPWLQGREQVIKLSRLTARGVLLATLRTLVLTATIVLVLAVPVLREHDAFYLCFLPLIWICVHHGLPGATLATLLVMMVGLVSMRLEGTTKEFTHVFLLFELAVSSVGLGLGTMVTRRTEAERKLAGNRAKLDRVTEGAQLGLWELDLATSEVEYNERFAAMIGYRMDEISPFVEHWPKLIHEADRLRVRETLWAHVAGGSELFETEFRLRTKAGHWRWLYTRGSIMERDASGRPLRMSGTQVDVTDRKRAEAQVSRLFRIIEATPDYVIIVNIDGQVLYANAAMLGLCGRAGGGTFEVGVHFKEVVAEGVCDQLKNTAVPAAMATGIWHGEVTIIDAAGRKIPTGLVMLAQRDEETDEHTFAIIMRDLSEQKRAEAERLRHDREVLQVQKAESLGVLAGGVAHDFNNLLTAIVGNANLALLELAEGSSTRAHIERIELAANKAAALCQQMLSYAGRSAVAFAEIDLNRLVKDACNLLDPSIGKKVRVRLELEKSLPEILAASTQMQQVVMNLVLNAAQAFGDREGVVHVRTRGRLLDEAALRAEFPGKVIAPGSYVVLEVEDTGCGMTTEVQERIFEPFYTTKGSGQGLGLAAVGGVVKSHRGAIAVKSVPGEGTTFRVAFPALADKQVEMAVDSKQAEAVWSAEGPFLIVDDNVFIRDITAQLIARFGFTPLVAADGIEGVEVFRRHAHELKGVLLDLTMPRMDGFEAHAEMHRIEPSVPVILMSGFSRKLESLPPEAIHPAGVLEKPFGIEQLQARLKSVLGGRI